MRIYYKTNEKSKRILLRDWSVFNDAYTIPDKGEFCCWMYINRETMLGCLKWYSKHWFPGPHLTENDKALFKLERFLLTILWKELLTNFADTGVWLYYDH